MRLGHAAFLVEDLDRMTSFYCETLGFAVSDVGRGAGRSTGPRAAFLSWTPSTLHHQLAFIEVNRDPKAPRNVHHIAFEVDSLDDLRTVWKRVANDPRASSLDPNTVGPVTAFMGDQWSIRFTDPEGNGIEIYAPTPWDAVAAAAPYTASGFAFEPFDIDASDDALAVWGAQHMDTMGQEHWPRGERPWPRT
jgi:catechol 2,3-dioxygenase-like lactoylglutathione lyase family enzyme